MRRGIKYTPAAVEEMRKLREGGMLCRSIDNYLKLPKGACYQVLRARGLLSTKFHAHKVQPVGEHTRPPDLALAERDAARRPPVSLTAAIMGDPLPGRSALDKMRAPR